MQATDKNQPHQDGCPADVSEQILILRQMEIQLRNIPDKDDWLEVDVKKTLESLYLEIDNKFINEEATEKLFGSVCRNLFEQGFNVGEIVKFVNNRIGYKGGPPYCDQNEVKEVIG